MLMTALMLTVLLQAGEGKVAAIQTRRASDVAALLTQANLPPNPPVVLLRALKEEQLLELWAGAAHSPLKLLKTYPICAASGVLGPKRKEGDLQVPEGLYQLTQLNPFSSYHLSLRVNYPNASDVIRSNRSRPGGLIYLHGSCASIGCIAIEDGPIEEVYLLAQQAKARHIHIFPFRMTPERMAQAKNDSHFAFWSELLPFFERFEAEHRVLPFGVDSKTGAYRLAQTK